MGSLEIAIVHCIAEPKPHKSPLSLVVLTPTIDCTERSKLLAIIHGARSFDAQNRTKTHVPWIASYCTPTLAQALMISFCVNHKPKETDDDVLKHNQDNSITEQERSRGELRAQRKGHRRRTTRQQDTVTLKPLGLRHYLQRYPSPRINAFQFPASRLCVCSIFTKSPATIGTAKVHVRRSTIATDTANRRCGKVWISRLDFELVIAVSEIQNVTSTGAILIHDCFQLSLSFSIR